MKSKAILQIGIAIIVSTLMITCVGSSFAQPPSGPKGDGKLPGAAKKLDNKVIHYTYHTGASFRVLIHDEKLSWEGTEGRFKGRKKTVEPKFDEIAPDVYFITWRNLVGGADSVTYNLKEMKIFTHVVLPKRLFALQGAITCFGDRSDCKPPQLEE